MTRYDRKKMIERIILEGRAACIKCEKDVSEGITSVDDILDTVETRKINNMLPKTIKNCSLVHLNCIKSLAKQLTQADVPVENEESNLEIIIGILSKGPIGGWQACKICKKDLTNLDAEELEKLIVYRARANTPAYLVHPQCREIEGK